MKGSPILKGFVKRVAELKKKTKEQLVNYIIEQERKRREKYQNLIRSVDSLEMRNESLLKENKELEKMVSSLRAEIKGLERELGFATGTMKMRDEEVAKLIEANIEIEKKISDVVLNRFNRMKTRFLSNLVEEKVSIEREKMKRKKDEDLLEIFEMLGVPREKVIQIIKERT